MKWLGTLINALVLLALSTLLGAWLQPIVKPFSNDPPIKATIDLSKWIEKPAKAGVEQDRKDVPTEVRDARHELFMSPASDRFMTVELVNEGSETVKNARMTFDDDRKADVLTVTEDGSRRDFVKGLSDIKLPEFLPGDKVRLYLWSDYSFSRVLVPLALKTYSSSGPFDITYTRPNEREYYEQKGAIATFIDDWFPTIGFVSLLLVAGLAFIGIHFQEVYYKKLLSDDVLFSEEKARYDADPKKFSPKVG